MASFVKSDGWSEGNKKVLVGTYTLGTYATGGEALAASVFGLRKISNLTFSGPAFKSDYTDAVVPTWVRSTGKVACYRQKDPAAAGGADIAVPEVANSTSLAAYACEVRVTGW